MLDPDEITRAQERYLNTVEFVEDTFIGDMSKALRRATANIERSFRRLLDGLQTGPGGYILDTADNRALLRALRQKIEAEMQLYLLARGRTFAERAVKSTHKAGRVRVIDTMPGVKTAITKLDARQITAYTGLSHDFIARLDVDTANYIRHVLTRSALEGWSPRQVAKSIVEGGQLKAGPVHTVETRAELWARTEPRRVAEEAQLSRFQDAAEDDNPWGQWIAIKDRRTGLDSRLRHGRVLRLREWRGRRWSDGLSGLPPLRPRDRCSIQWLVKSDWTDSQWETILAGTPWYDVMN